MARFNRVIQGESGFSDWVQPTMAGYKMACCDCGLVHDLEFKVVEVVRDLSNGYKEIQDTENGQFIVHFRARRNNRSTGQLRRKR